MNTGSSRNCGHTPRLSTTLRSAAALVLLLAGTLAPHASADEPICPDGYAENLRNAIRAANDGTGPTTINLAACAYDYTSGAPDGIDSALPLIRAQMTIQGPASGLVSGHASIRRTGGVRFRIFVVTSSGNLTLRNVLVSGGRAPNGTNGDPATPWGDNATSGSPGYDGGALYNDGTVVIEDARFDDHHAGEGGLGGTGSKAAGFTNNTSGNGGPGGKGGTFYNSGRLTIRRSIVTYGRGGDGGIGGACGGVGGHTCRGGNGGSGGEGGGLFLSNGATAIVEFTTFYLNAAGAGGLYGEGTTGEGKQGWGGNGSHGGAIHSFGHLTIEDSTIASNEATDGVLTISGDLGGGNGGFGGGIAATQGSLTIRRSTISSNRGGRAGGSSSTTLEGQPGGGGGLYIDTSATIENSTIAGNSAGNEADCASASDGGGIYAGANANLTLKNVTISGNTLPAANACGGHPVPVYASAASIYNKGKVSLFNSILSNAAWKGPDGDEFDSLEEMPNCGGTGTLNVYEANISWSAVFGSPHEDGFGCVALLERDPKLPVIPVVPGSPPDPFHPRTLAPGAGSAAVNAGEGCLLTDQDLVTRPQGPKCDLGAVEVLTTIVQHPSAVTVDDGSTYSFSATVDVDSLGAPSSVTWQTSTDGASWQDGVPDGSGSLLPPTTSTLTETSAGRWKSAATFPEALPSQTNLLFRAVFRNEVFPDGLATNGAKLTVRVRFLKITTDLQSLTVNTGSLFHIPFAYEAYPAVTTVLWEVWKGSAWETLMTLPGSEGAGTNHADTATLAMNGWKYRVTLSGGYPGRPSLTSSEAILTVTNDTTSPRINPPTNAIALDGSSTEMARFNTVVTGNPPPTILWRMQDETGSMVELTNGDVADLDAFHYNTTPGSLNSAQLWFRAWGDQDLRFADALARNSSGAAHSDRAQLFVRTNTATALDCPAQALFLSTYTCRVTVTSVAANPARPRVRKTCGEVLVRGQLSEPRCTLDANGSCEVTFQAPNSTWTSVNHDAIYLGGNGTTACVAGGAPPDVNSQSTSEDVQLTDCLKPTITSCPAPVTVDGDASCGAQVPDLLDAVGVSETGCQVSLSQDPPAGAPLSGAGPYDVTITATTAGGSTSCTARVTVRDTTPPVITLTGANPLVMSCEQPISLFEGVSAADLCDGEVDVRIEGAQDVEKPGSHTITYVATDEAGNAAEPVRRTVIVKDEAAPELKLNGPASVTIGCGEEFQDPGATASDDCEGGLPVTTSGTFDRSTPGTYTLTYRAKDSSGNEASKTRTIEVVDQQQPTVQLNGLERMTLECGATFEDPGVTASDACAGDNVTVKVIGTVNTSVAGNYHLHYEVKDPSGNTGGVGRLVIVQGSGAASITVEGANPATVECHSPYTDPGATSKDACGNPVPVTPSGVVDVNTPGSYQITYSAISGGVTQTAFRTVNVVDSTKPTITMNGEASMTIECHGTFTEPGASASDICAGTLPVTPISTVNVNVPGTYTVTYEATDPAGNKQTAVRNVTVSDTQKPTITLNGSASMTVECHTSFTDPGAGADDSCAGSFAATPSGSVNVNVPGVYTLTYSASDPSGNAATAVTRTVTVVDTTKPTIQCPANITVAAVAGSCAAPATFNVGHGDSCDGAPRLVLSHPSGSSFPLGTTTVNAIVTDASGNSSSCSFTVTVVKSSTTTSVSLLHASRQYSDANTFTANVVDTLTSTPVNGGTVTFRIGGSVAGTSNLVNGTASLSLNLVESATLAKADLAPGGRNVTATYNGDSPTCAGQSTSPAQILTIQKEDARTSYTGGVFSSTSCPSCSDAVVTLSATVWDITATSDASGDTLPGDIRNATVTFLKVDGATETAIGTVNVGLVNAGDTKVGMATYNWNVNIGSSDSEPYTIGIRVNGYYTRSSSNDYTVVTVAKPIGTNFISGGGYLTLTSSAGMMPGDAGTKNNFGFNVKYNKSGNSLQGRINTILRRKEADGLVHVYQIKGNAMTSLTADAKTGKAVFNGKANITDVTDPLAPVTVDGNGTLTVTMTDKGEPGSSDTIGISLFNKNGGLWFSSHYENAKTVEKVLNGGNLVVR